MKKLLFTLLLAAAVLPGWAEQYPDALYAVGDATSFDWGPNNSPATAPVLYKKSDKIYEGFVNFDTTNGMLKFLVTNAYNQGQWGPATNGHSITNTTVTKEYIEYTSQGWDDSDKKFLFNLDLGLYLITADLTEGSESFTFKKWISSDVYEIGSLAQLKAFADGVNKFDASINAALTADITDAMDYAIGWYDNGTSNKLYSGEFNGNGHTVTLAINDENNSNKGLFGAATGGANIHDVIVAGSVTAKAKAGGIVGTTGGTGTIMLTNVINTATIHSAGNSDANAAGLVGCILSNTNVHATNCANTGNVSGQDGQCAAFAGWTQSGTTFTNCWNIGEINNIESQAQLYRNSGQSTATNCYDLTNVGNQGTKLDASTQGSGELCYKLNGSQQGGTNWYQNLTGTVDAYPVPFSTHSQVYANGEMNCAGDAVEGGTLTYSNSSTSTIPPHTYNDGWCDVCGAYEANAFSPVDGWYEISTAKQLRWMAESVTEHNSTYGNANIKLTANIDYSAYTDQAAMFGKPSNTFKGVFDGQCHTVTVAFDNNSADETALFRRINGGTVKNLKVAGTITTNQKLAGGICSGIWQKGTITNCESAVTITDEGSGDATHGGILAAVHDKTNTGINILNCLFSGSIVASNRTGSGGIIGWPASGATEVKVYNCLVTGTINLKDDNNNDVIVRDQADVQNCYYSCTLTNNLRNSKSATAVAEGEAASGALCYKLNGSVSGAANWFQTLGTDNTPTPFSTSSKIYTKGSFLCDGVTPKEGAEVSYTNTDNESFIEAHTFGTDGVCTACHAAGEEATETDGAYQLTNAGKLLWWSQYVNAGHTDANAVLTTDVDLTGAKYAPIGNTNNIYVGHFDGQGHSVTLALNNPDKDYQGLFGVVTDGVKIEKVIVKGSVTGKSFVGGIVGGTNGGSSNAKKTDIWYCGNEATVTATGPNGAGILGVNMNGSASIIITNCYNTGNITSGNDGGAISGWLGGGWSSVRNTYNIGTVKNVENSSTAFGRNSGCSFTNCYYSGSSGTSTDGNPTMVADTEVASGKLCYLLNGDQSQIAFYQSLGTDTHPTINFNQPKVFKMTVGDAGYASFVPEVNIATLPTGVTAYVGQKNGNSLHLEEVTTLPADNAFVVKADKGDYYYNNTTESITLSEDNDLDFYDVATAANGTQYCLSNKASGVGFYKVGNDVMIPARKAYLAVTAGTGTKEFYSFDDDATAIEMVNGQSSMVNGPIYNLAGQRLGKMQKGINIINGKKILK